MIELALKSERKGTNVLLNAGRGNPNWTAATPRQAFFTLGQFAVEGGTAAMCYIFLACIVNPSNPPSVAINEESMKYIKKIVEKFKERA